MDFPAPFGPVTPIISPARKESDTFDKMCFPPRDVLTAVRVTMKDLYEKLLSSTSYIVDRLYIRKYYGTIIYFLVLSAAALSVSFVFSLPEPIRPKTSIGLMNATVLAAVFISVFVKGRRMPLLTVANWNSLDFSVIGYFGAVALSLFLANRIDDSTPFRLLLSGVLLHFLLSETQPTEQQKKYLIHFFGGLGLLFALLSVLQAALPDVMNSVADIFLHGRFAYGITVEFNRGRLLHWGSLIFVFPFFYASALLIKWKDRIWQTLYVFGGFITLLGAVVMSNFRGEFLIFLFISFLYLVAALYFKYITRTKVYYLFLFSILTAVFGLMFAKTILGYNLLERFFFANPYRDVTETLGRITLYDQALTIFLAAPITGVGYGNYYSVVWPFPILQYFSVFDQLSPLPVPIASHNEFYTALAETGVLGFTGFLFILYFIGKQSTTIFMKTISSASTDGLLSLTVIASYLSIIIYIWFENIYPQNIVYILLLGGIVTHWIKPHETARKKA